MNDFFQFNNDKPTICFTRIRSSEKYTRPLQSIADSMFHVCNKFMHNNPQYNYNLFGLSFSTAWPNKIYQNIADSDYIVIPSEAEFMFHIPDRVMTIVKKRTDEVLDGVREVIDGKTIIILQSDRADSVELYRDYVFPDNDVKIHSIDECDFKGGLHSLKYHFIKQRFHTGAKIHDFGYWGTSKKKKVGGGLSGDVRHEVLKDLHKSDLKTLFIGNFDGFQRDIKFTRKLENIVPHLMNCKTTLCFNWPGYDEYLTSRYNEALACDIIPLVWKNYDINNQLVESNWQRCYSFEDIQRKCLELRDEGVRLERLKRIKKKYNESTEGVEYYEKEFENKLRGIIDD
tara:strand:+ start:5293 stop:6321 length:1029 start_codon:yes stop_codon:yes gene_type:complete